MKAKIVRVIYSVERVGKVELEEDADKLDALRRRILPEILSQRDNTLIVQQRLNLGWVRVDQEKLMLDDLYVEEKE